MKHRAWICSELCNDFSGLRLETRDARPCATGEVRVQVRAAALNFPDPSRNWGATGALFVCGLLPASLVLNLSDVTLPLAGRDQGWGEV